MKNPLTAPVLFVWLENGEIAVREYTVRWKSWLFGAAVFIVACVECRLKDHDFRILPL